MTFSGEVSDDQSFLIIFAEHFLQQKGLTRIIRREISFGLIPKTLTRKSSEILTVLLRDFI